MRETLRALAADPRVAIARRDLASLSREKTIVLALLIQLFVAAFSSFLVVGLTSLYDPGSVAAGEVEVGVTGEARDALARAAYERDGTEPLVFEDRAVASAAFQQGRVDALLDGRYVDGRIAVEASAPRGSLRTTLVVVQLRGVLTTLERNERVARAPSLSAPLVPVPPGANASPYFGFTYTVLVPLLLFLPPFISGSISVDAVTEEIERGTLELLRVAPVSLVDVVDGKAAATVLLAPLQAVLWIGLMGANGIAVANVPALLLVVTAVATLVVGLGVGLGLVLAERRSAQLLYSVGVLGFFGAAVLLPEHPATTVALLAVDSATATTVVHVAGYAVLALAVVVLGRRFVGRVDAESL